MKRLAARSALFGALLLLTACNVSIAREPPLDAPAPLAESTPAPPSPQNTAPPTDTLTVKEPASECSGAAVKPCRNKKAEVGRPNITARKVEARRKAETKRKAAEQRKAKAAALQRLTEERKAQEARPKPHELPKRLRRSGSPMNLSAPSSAAAPLGSTLSRRSA